MFNVTDAVKSAVLGSGWFRKPGAYVLVDGQFGSTGKGLLASVLAEIGVDRITVTTTNAGPNSGHTAYSPVDGEKIMMQQIPVAAVVQNLLGKSGIAYLNAGAILNQSIVADEAARYGFNYRNLWIHPNAAIIEEHDVKEESKGSVAKIASTAKGVGSALARKIMREGNIARTYHHDLGFFSRLGEFQWDWRRDHVLVETAQGFSLGINSKFYPYTTSRECTVMQAITDARIPYNKVQKVAACYRTFPIRVGNTDVGKSGPGYSDQQETTWEAIGVAPELTSVTKRVRRVFTWSWEQFEDSVRVNQPDLLFINFIQYLEEDKRDGFLVEVNDRYEKIMGKWPGAILVGHGPNNGNVKVF